MRKKVGKLSLITGVVLLLVGYPALAEKITLHLISHKYPATEFYAQALSEEAPPDVKVEASLMPWEKWQEKARISFSAGSSAYDITFADHASVADFAAKGWLIPLNKYIEKYEDEFHFSDIPQRVWDVVTYQGEIYAIPLSATMEVFFYRDDLFKQAGLQPPKTLEEYVEVAAKLTTPQRYGISMTLRYPVRSEFHSYLHACGGSWFNEEGKPAINEPEGVMALIYMKRLMKYAPPGALSYGNDESMVAMQQDKVAMMIQWMTRAAPMDDPKISKVVNLVQWSVPPSLGEGGVPASVLSVDTYAIPSFTKHDPEIIFQTIARATDKETMRRGSELIFSPRLSVANDPELVAKYRHWPAAGATMQTAARYPPHPGFIEVAEIVGRRIAQALVGELKNKKALDLAAQESYELLKKRGYLRE